MTSPGRSSNVPCGRAQGRRTRPDDERFFFLRVPVIRGSRSLPAAVRRTRSLGACAPSSQPTSAAPPVKGGGSARRVSSASSSRFTRRVSTPLRASSRSCSAFHAVDGRPACRRRPAGAARRARAACASTARPAPDRRACRRPSGARAPAGTPQNASPVIALRLARMERARTRPAVLKPSKRDRAPAVERRRRASTRARDGDARSRRRPAARRSPGTP